MDVMELVRQPWFWPAVTALVTLAALVGSGFSWAVATYFRWRTRPEPDWMFSLVGFAHDTDERTGEPARIVVGGNVSNVGDGSAHSVKILGARDCVADIYSRSKTRGMVPIMDKGDTESVNIEMSFDAWNSAEVILEWIVPPTRLKKRKELRVDLPSMMEVPKVQYTDDDGILAYRPVK